MRTTPHNSGNKSLYRAGTPRNPALVFLHGFMGTGADWLPIMNALRHRFYCLAPDLPGHGSAPPPPRGGFSAYSRSVHTAIQTSVNGPCALVGYSLGGRIALKLGLEHPSRFYKIILESASPGLPTTRERETRIASDQKLCSTLKLKGLEHFLIKWYEKPIFRSLTPELKLRLIQLRLNQDSDSLIRVLRSAGTGRMTSLWTKLKSNKVPQLLITGALDSKFSRIAIEMVKRGTDFNTVQAAGCSHIVHLENPAFFIRHCKSFLGSDAPTSAAREYI